MYGKILKGVNASETLATTCSVLVVDDHGLVRETLARALRRHFFEVLTAADREEAERALEHHTVTHLVCDWNLGKDHPRGTELVPLWRERWPSITSAVIFSGAFPGDITISPMIDGVVDKAQGLEALLEALDRKHR